MLKNMFIDLFEQWKDSSTENKRYLMSVCTDGKTNEKDWLSGWTMACKSKNF